MNWLKKTIRFGEKIKKIFKRRATKDEIENSDNGDLAFKALMRLMDKIDPSYRN